MRHSPYRLPLLPLLALGLVLQGCGSNPEQAQPPTNPEDVELTLNLPDEDCVCQPEAEALDATFLERGFDALNAGDHIGAVQHFQRYRRLEKSPQADWESAVAIAFMGTLPNSPFFAPAEARKAYRTVRKERDPAWIVHPQVLLVTNAMDMFLETMRYTRELEDQVEALEEDVEKKEEALKRLRELTLGQQAR